MEGMTQATRKARMTHASLHPPTLALFHPAPLPLFCPAVQWRGCICSKGCWRRMRSSTMTP